MDEISYEKLGNNILENTLTSLTLFDDMQELKLFDDLNDKDRLKLEAAVAVVTVAITAVANVVNLNLETRKQISTYRKQNVILLETITVLKRENFKYDLVITRVAEIFASLEKSLQAFEFIYNDVSKTVNPHGIISVLLGILKFLVQPNKVKQGGINEIRENYVKKKRRDFSLAL